MLVYCQRGCSEREILHLSSRDGDARHLRDSLHPTRFRHCRCQAPPPPAAASAVARARGSPQPRGPPSRQSAPAARGVAASPGEEDQPRLWGRTQAPCAGMAALLGRVLRRGVAPLARAAPAQQRRAATSHSENTYTFINEVGPASTP